MPELGEHKKMLSADEQATLVEALMATRGFVLLGRVEEVLRWTKEAHT